MKNLFTKIGIALLALASVVAIGSFAQGKFGQTGDQRLSAIFFVGDGVSTGGSGVLQVGELGTLSASTNTGIARVVTAGAGSIYLRALWVEKMTTGTGSITVSYGTGTNCGTGTTTLFSMAMAASQIPTLGEYKINIPLPAAKDLCVTTDASTTAVRVITN